jgi:NAD dependent epimerase/dehydratase family enzyme
MAGDMSEMVLYGPKTVPMRTIESGFKFKFKNLDDALRDIDK